MRAASRQILLGTLGGLALLEGSARGRAVEEPIRMVWQEGDVAGTTSIFGPEDQPIGVVEYWQVRRGDRLSSHRIARFADGSSDEDEAEARVGDRLEALAGRSIIRDTAGRSIVDIAIDVPGGRIKGTVGHGEAQRPVDVTVTLPPSTYWGPLVFLVLKNFASNAEDGRVVFRTVVPTPEPRVFDLALTDDGPSPVERVGLKFEARRYGLAPSLNRIIDPLIRRLVGEATFFVLPGDPPGIVRFAGPRNYDRQQIRIQ